MKRRVVAVLVSSTEANGQALAAANASTTVLFILSKIRVIRAIRGLNSPIRETM